MDNKKIFLDVLNVPSEKPDPDVDTEELMDMAFEKYKWIEIISNINSGKFKEVYLIFRNDIKQKPFVEQKEFLLLLIEKILKTYNVDFMTKFYINDEYELKLAYDFVEFFMFKYVDFYTKIWDQIMDWTILNDIDVKSYVLENPSKFIKTIDMIINKSELPILYKDLMVSVSGPKLLQIFIDFTNFRKQEIILSLIELNMKNIIKGI